MRQNKNSIALQARVYALIGRDFREVEEGLSVRDVMNAHAATFTNVKPPTYAMVNRAIDSLIDQRKLRVSKRSSGSRPALVTISGKSKWPTVDSVRPETPPEHFNTRSVIIPVHDDLGHGGGAILEAVRRNGSGVKRIVGMGAESMASKLRRLADLIEAIDALDV